MVFFCIATKKKTGSTFCWTGFLWQSAATEQQPFVQLTFPSKTEPLGRFRLLTAVDIRLAEPARPYVIIISQRDPWTNLYQQYLQLQEAEAEVVFLPEPWSLWRTADSSLTWWKWINTETTRWRVWKTSCYFSWPRVSRFSRLSRSCLLSCNAEVITLETPPSPKGTLLWQMSQRGNFVKRQFVAKLRSTS